ncbi:hypothetical protein KSP40_PGU008176 [Platanthera guangdongensis]|uniref:Coatomer alpha subunit C-terminal domain-containing protein n=1 Tax=Platanthera guangdongensis TaxID=2320717 RepID=A0ABR2LS07_9ASPA
MQQHFEQKIDLPEILYQITSRFDCLYITPRSLDILANGSPVCGDLALSLSQAGPQFSQVLRRMYAIKALRFPTALSILKDEYLRSRYYPQCPPTSYLFHRFQQLAHACIMHGQFDCAKETYEVISDFESMLDLFICHFNPSAMRRLAEGLEDAATDSDLIGHCRRILAVRSTVWTQSSTFTNFSTETMAPKGPEWGGGNWEIKTPTNMNSIPQWELAGEVMPYMKTDDGAIPSIIPNHIGVFLGAIKGRGNVVEGSENSLVKPFKATGGRNKDSTVASMTIDSKNDSFMDSVDVAPPDEQQRAEVEFKRSFYGSFDSCSSEEDDASSKTKIRIKIHEKPATGSMVDVNKLKEATKQFKIGDPPMRNKSVPLNLSLPAPGTTTPSISTFGAAGVSSGPIPEDFFENTISSIDVAASLPPPGVYLSKLNKKFRENKDGEEIRGLESELDSGVPPRVSQQSGILLEGVGLPDGGIPPQVKISSPRMNNSSQAIDLSSFEVPVSNSMKSLPILPPAPAFVPPGQVPLGAPASVCFKAGLSHLEQNQLGNALSCFDEVFLALAKDRSNGSDIKSQATICAHYKIAVAILQEIARLQKVRQGSSAIYAKEEMSRLSRHLGSLPLLAKHRITCVRTAIKRNIEVQNFASAKQMLDLLLSKAPPGKRRDELRNLADMCAQRGLANRSADPREDPSQFCAATLSRLSTIGHDVCDLCGSKFSAPSSPKCIVCGMGRVGRSDAIAVPPPLSLFG